MNIKFILILAATLLFSQTAFAESVAAGERQGYFKHVCGWEKIEQEKIYAPDELVFHLDSDEMTSNLNARVMPLNASEKHIDYSTSDISIASVDENGNISVFNKPGEATIYMTSGKAYAECKINVIRGVTGISLAQHDITFYADQPITSQLNATVFPADATNKNIKWKSDDTSIAGVDENGVVTPCGIGSVNITAETEDGGFKASCVVRVTFHTVTAKAVFITNAIDVMPINGVHNLDSYIYPENASDKSVHWSSSNTDIAEINENGSLIGKGEGMAVITLTGAGGIEDSFTISVVPDDGNVQSSIISKPVSERIAELSMPVAYSKSSSTLSQAVSAQMSKSPTVFTTNASAASQADVEKYIDPKNFSSGYGRYQFVDLSGTSGISSQALNAYLSDKGVLKNKADVFIEASKKYNVSEIYLAVHASLESGNGSSQLAQGISFNGTTVYNMFGIGAYDSDPINGGAKYAYDKGWTSIEKAIEGGAEWISENYIGKGQNTLYKMRWNPSKPGNHQYATDVAWAVKQAKSICNMFSALPDSHKIFEVPVYSGEDVPVINYE